MPVDQSTVHAMLGAFRSMMAECEEKKISSPDVSEMKNTLLRMEQLAGEADDAAAYSGRLMQENLFMKFSEHYGKALAATASGAAHSTYDEKADQQLLNQSVQAYRDAISRIRQNKEEVKQLLGSHASDADVLLKEKIYTDAIGNLVELGSTGISYPEFLCRSIERGLDKAMEGSIHSRDAQLYITEAALATAASPFEIQKEEEKLLLFDRLVHASPFKTADNLQYNLGCEKIEWQYAPAIARWNKIKQGWEKAAFWLDEWITSYCSVAPHIKPWIEARNPCEAVQESQECVPGKLRVWENINRRYFGLSLKELFRHESFEWDVRHEWMYWSQEYMEFLLKKIEPLCHPGAVPAEGLIEQASRFHNDKRKVSPALQEPSLRYAAYFDRYFGAGEYARRFGLPEKAETNAAAWDFETFNF